MTIALSLCDQATAPAATIPPLLVVHNKYRWLGGEDVEVQAEVDLLRSLGGDIATMIYESEDRSKLDRLRRRPYELVYNRAARDHARALIRRHGLRLVHCHNLVPLLSPSIYAAAAAEGVPVVQSLHNFRLGCLNGLHLRHGQICELCRPGHHLPGMAFGCYRGSRVESVAFGLAQTTNHWVGAWKRPTVYAVPTPFLREKLIKWGINGDTIVVKPYFVPHDPVPRPSSGKHALFIGRLAEEKGLDLLLDVWTPDRLPLVIAGEGPLRAHLEQRVNLEGKANVRFAGFQDSSGIHLLLSEARFLVMPSVWFETLGLVLIEAYAHGVPVIATRLGAMADVVLDGVTGLLFALRDRSDLGEKLTMLENDAALREKLSTAARREYERRYSREVQAESLRALYAQALDAYAARPDPVGSGRR